MNKNFCTNWKGGRVLNSQGYVLIYQPEHPFCSKQKYVREHRLVVEQNLKRYLLVDEVVHHINGDKKDNRLENLQVLNKRDHDRLSMQERPRKKLEKICPICEKSFLVYLSQSWVLCCSRNCSAKKRWESGKSVFGR